MIFCVINFSWFCFSIWFWFTQSILIREMGKKQCLPSPPKGLTVAFYRVIQGLRTRNVEELLKLMTPNTHRETRNKLLAHLVSPGESTIGFLGGLNMACIIWNSCWCQQITRVSPSACHVGKNGGREEGFKVINNAYLTFDAPTSVTILSPSLNATPTLSFSETISWHFFTVGGYHVSLHPWASNFQRAC